jgi:hypothetical protein
MFVPILMAKQSSCKKKYLVGKGASKLNRQTNLIEDSTEIAISVCKSTELRIDKPLLDDYIITGNIKSVGVARFRLTSLKAGG